MPARIAINGFGRTGRHVLRALVECGAFDRDVEVVAIGDPAPADNPAYLLKHDSTQGRFSGVMGCTALRKADAGCERGDADPPPNILTVNGSRIPVISVPRPAASQWKALGVDLVIETTGFFNDHRARDHIHAGAKKVIIAGMAKEEDATLIMGINHRKYDPRRHHVVSAASPSTCSLAPLVHVLLSEGIGIEEGFMTTLRAAVDLQKTVDSPSRLDWRGGRAAGINIIPSASGAAKCVGLVIPEAKGKLHGMAFLLPNAIVSVTDFTVRTIKETSYSAICAAMKRASETYLKGILDYTEDEVVSSDLIHCPACAVFDAGSGIELNSRFFKLVSWYDNEWGFACHVASLLQHIVGKRL